MGTYLGQNFLNNEKIIDFIVEEIKNNVEDTYQTIEIGPGKCALTEKLSFIENLKVFEKDESFYENLQNCIKKENIIMGDFLSADLTKHIDTDFFYAVGNLPYYITSPIFKKLTNPENKKKMKWGIFMIQKEVGKKIENNSNKKTMLSFLLQYNYEIKYLKTVPASDFTPAPKVDSCLVSFKYIGENKNIEFDKLQKILTIFTAYKRKKLGKIEKILEKQGKNLIIPEELKDKRFTALSFEEIEKIGGNY